VIVCFKQQYPFGVFLRSPISHQYLPKLVVNL
jgi:hypothetical protein